LEGIGLSLDLKGGRMFSRIWVVQSLRQVGRLGEESTGRSPGKLDRRRLTLILRQA